MFLATGQTLTIPSHIPRYKTTPYQSMLLYDWEMSEAHSTKQSKDLRQSGIYRNGIGTGVHEGGQIL